MAWKEIVDYTVPSNTTSVDITGLNITKDDFIKIHTTIVNPDNQQNTFTLRPNGTTSDNFYTQLITANGSSVSASRFGNNEFAFRYNVVLAQQTGTSFCYLKISENNKLNIFGNFNFENTNLLNTRYEYATSIDSFSNVTSLQFRGKRDGTSSIGANSRIQIYKLEAEKVADIKVSSNTTQIDITGLDIQKGSEYLLISNRLWATANTGLNLAINNDTTYTNYWSQSIRGDGSTASAIRSNAPIMSTSAVSGQPNLSYSYIKLSNTGSYTVQNYTIRRMGSDLRIENIFISSISESISSINQLNIISTTTNTLGAGSRFELYKLY